MYHNNTYTCYDNKLAVFQKLPSTSNNISDNEAAYQIDQ